MIRFQVHLHGPMWTHEIDRLADQMLLDIRTDLAASALQDVMRVLSSPHPIGIRVRTPYYETRLNVEEGPDLSRVNDDNVIYGPWLEGTSSRNQTTRFKGYSAFRKAFQQLERRIPAVIERHRTERVRQMND